MPQVKLYRGVGRRKLPISFIKEVTDRCLMFGNESSLLWKADVADLLELSVRYSNPDKSARKFVKNFTEHEKVLIYLSIHQLKSNIPDQFITSLCNCFSSICDEIYRLSRFYLCFHSLLEINHAGSFKLPPKLMRGWADPWGFIRKVYFWKKRLDFLCSFSRSKGTKAAPVTLE